MGKVLLIDDALDIGELILDSLKPHFVRHVLSIADAEIALSEMRYDIILIDVGLPDGNGFEFCNKLNNDSRFAKTTRVLLTARDQPAEKVHGFSCGADDYITKPFHPLELKARVERYLEKQEVTPEGIANHSCFAFHLEFQRCFKVIDGVQTDLQLTPTEFRLLYTLVKHEGRVLTRRMLEQMAWESNGTVIEIRGVDTHIAHLRKKLGDLKNLIVSVYGTGYSYSQEKAKIKAA
jgi:DNA-binding response OmpR family regulator